MTGALRSPPADDVWLPRSEALRTHGLLMFWRALRSVARRPGYALRILAGLSGVSARQCPACAYEGLFHSVGYPPRFDARCPQCGSLERHRLLFLLDRDHDLFPAGARVLHFAPEAQLKRYLVGKVGDYKTSEFDGVDADYKLDIEAIALPSSSFDIVISSHVLEHVDDRKALAEMLRILEPGGVAYLMTPVVEGWQATYEDAGIAEPGQRWLHFGQTDHVRQFGRDIRERIRNAGFVLEELSGTPEQCVRYGLIRGETLFIGRKPR